MKIRIREWYKKYAKRYIPRWMFALLNVLKRLFHIPFPESQLAHHYLDGLSGLEIGASYHNPFGLRTKNVDYTDSYGQYYKKLERKIAGRSVSVDIVAPGDAIPLSDESQDFVVSSHVLEHFPDPIKALKEWYRLIRSGGYIFMIIPHKERTFDREFPRTTLQELVRRHEGRILAEPNVNDHYSVWVTEDITELIRYLGWNIVDVQDADDKAGNGFTVVVRK